jgi:hypothetical protein
VTALLSDAELSRIIFVPHERIASPDIAHGKELSVPSFYEEVLHRIKELRADNCAIGVHATRLW